MTAGALLSVLPGPSLAGAALAPTPGGTPLLVLWGRALSTDRGSVGLPCPGPPGLPCLLPSTLAEAGRQALLLCLPPPVPLPHCPTGRAELLT